MSQVQFAIFDFDGTLADSFPWFLSVLDAVARRWGLRPLAAGEEETLRHLSASAVFRRLGVPCWKGPLIAADLRRRMARDIDGIELFDGVAPMLERLAGGGLRLGLVSSNGAENIRRVLGPRLWSLIDVAECDAGIAGKHRRLTRLLKRTDADRAHALYIGDEIRDIEAAHRAGIRVGVVTWGYNRAQVLMRHHPHLRFDRVQEISRCLLTSE